eukprot:2768347-Prymnesium_polylepis.1
MRSGQTGTCGRGTNTGLCTQQPFCSGHNSLAPQCSTSPQQSWSMSQKTSGWSWLGAHRCIPFGHTGAFGGGGTGGGVLGEVGGTGGDAGEGDNGGIGGGGDCGGDDGGAGG